MAYSLLNIASAALTVAQTLKSVKKSAGLAKKSAASVRGTVSITADTIAAAIAMKANNMKGALTMEMKGLENTNFSFWASEDSDTDTPDYRHSTTTGSAQDPHLIV